jgi:hypothetical protein
VAWNGRSPAAESPGDAGRNGAARQARGKTLKITSVNGVAKKLKAVSTELDALPESFVKYLTPSGGTYNCRVIAGTDRPSVHGNGIAIDINVAWSDYWRNYQQLANILTRTASPGRSSRSSRSKALSGGHMVSP